MPDRVRYDENGKVRLFTKPSVLNLLNFWRMNMKLSNYAPIILLLILNLVFPNFVFSKERLAVMNLKAKHGVEKSIADALSVEVRNGIHDLGIYEVLSKDDLDVLAERAAIMQKVDCETTSQCLIDFGRSIGTKYMVAGSISKMGETYTINLRLLDTEGENAGVKQMADKKCRCSEDELIDAAREVAKAVMYNETLQNVQETGEPKIDSATIEKQSEQEGWFSKYKWWIAAGVVLIAGGAAAAGGGGGGDTTSSEPASTTSQGSATVSW